MNEVILFILWFLLVYLVYYLVVISKKKKLNKLVKSTECVYLEKKYHINVSKIPVKTLANQLALTNAFIISSTVFLVNFVNGWILKFGCCIFVLIILIFICYHILGKYYQRKYKEEVK